MGPVVCSSFPDCRKMQKVKKIIQKEEFFLLSVSSDLMGA
jgi:hypothetical protein